jgi:proline-specific peptidase
MAEMREGFAEVPGGRVYYKVVGAGPGVPLLTLHGGPGAGHDFFEPLELLGSERPVVFFDQLGCGRSDQPHDTRLWQLTRFVEEVKALRESLQLDEVHLIGQSWGGWLAIEYLLEQPSGVRSAVLYSTSASIFEAVRDLEKHRQALPQDVLETLVRCETEGNYENSQYGEIVEALMNRHFCRLDPWPDPLMRTMENAEASQMVYETMWGPNEFFASGNLQTWDRTDRLGEIKCPTLVICGAHDLYGPACLETLYRGIAGSEAHVFEQSSHLAHLEEPDHFFDVLRDFLARSELGS